MSDTVGLSVVLPEEFTPLSTHDAAMAKVETRLSSVEEDVSRLAPAQVEKLEAKVAALEEELLALRQSAATAADLDAANERIEASESGLTSLQAQVAGFSFRTGSVADLEAIGTLPGDQVFVVVDTPDNLAALGAEQSADQLAMSLAFGAATPSA